MFFRSGNLEFMNDENSFLVPVHNFSRAFPNEPQVSALGLHLSQLNSPQLMRYTDLDRHKWANIKEEDLMKVMRYVFSHKSNAGLFFLYVVDV